MKCVRIAQDFERASPTIIRAVGVAEVDRPMIEAFARMKAAGRKIQLTFRYDRQTQWLEMLPEYGGHLQVLPSDKAAERLLPIVQELRDEFQVDATEVSGACDSCA